MKYARLAVGFMHIEIRLGEERIAFTSDLDAPAGQTALVRSWAHDLNELAAAAESETTTAPAQETEPKRRPDEDDVIASLRRALDAAQQKIRTYQVALALEIRSRPTRASIAEEVVGAYETANLLANTNMPIELPF